MKTYGYLAVGGGAGADDSEALYGEGAIRDAISRVQLFGALPQTGQLDTDTIKVRIEFIINWQWKKCPS